MSRDLHDTKMRSNDHSCFEGGGVPPPTMHEDLGHSGGDGTSPLFVQFHLKLRLPPPPSAIPKQGCPPSNAIRFNLNKKVEHGHKGFCFVKGYQEISETVKLQVKGLRTWSDLTKTPQVDFCIGIVYVLFCMIPSRDLKQGIEITTDLEIQEHGSLTHRLIDWLIGWLTD